MISPEILKSYNSTRTIKNIREICHAPFANMYLNSTGHVGACWLTLDKGPRYPDLRLKDIWFGEYFNSLRDNIRNKNLSRHCQVCEKRIQDGVYKSVLAQAYDLEDDFKKFPTVMEFELSNLCNLACVMCKGTLSSKIRKERDRLPPLQSPYGEQFIEEMKEFLPHLKEARFNGGEPFLQPVCWKLWEQIAETNPKIEITVATNGSHLNDKMKKIMERCLFRVNVSLDSLDKNVYEHIRVGSHFETVLKNIDYYGEYCERKGTNFSLMVNPMRMNWRELPRFVEWTSERNINLWFNTVWRPRQLAIWNLPSMKIQEILDYLKTVKIDRPANGKEKFFMGNMGVYHNFVEKQLPRWIEEQVHRETMGTDYESRLKLRLDSKHKFSHRQIFKDNSTLFEQIEKRVAANLDLDNLYFFLNEREDWEINQYIQENDIDKMISWVYTIGDYY